MKPCSTCPYWRGDAALKPAAAPVLAANDAASDVSPDTPPAGRCYLNPPQMVMTPTPHPMDPRQVVMTQERLYPLTLAGEVHACHPDAQKDRVLSAITYAINAWRAHLSYKPGEHPDEIASGFSRVPSLTEAKDFAVGMDVRPGAEINGPLDVNKVGLTAEGAEIVKPVADELVRAAYLVKKAAQGYDVSSGRPVMKPRRYPLLERFFKWALNRTRGIK